MILNILSPSSPVLVKFAYKLNGKKTNFVEKIWAGFFNYQIPNITPMELLCFYREKFPTGDIAGIQMKFKPGKIHTIRSEDYNNIRIGTKLFFLTDDGKGKGDRFTPGLPLVSTQSILIHFNLGRIRVEIDGIICTDADIEILARNDGFDSSEEFQYYFLEKIHESQQKYYTGKIIHWTTLKY
jgi:hypothetical protein